ncbi:MAG: pyruvate kinase [bacterium]|nr:pyruvate kinase [bacterium]
MIIPTLRVDKKEKYKHLVEVYRKQNIKVLRVNMARHTLERYCEDIQYLQAIANDQFEIMADLPIPGKKYRLELLDEQEIAVKEKDMLVFLARNSKKEKGIPVGIAAFPVELKGCRILIGDGELRLRVQESSPESIKAIAENVAIIRGKRAFVLAEKMPYELYSKDFLAAYLKALKEIQPSKVVLSFAEDISELTKLKDIFEKQLPNASVVPKLETQKAIENCSEIFDLFEEVMLGRGDLALFGDVKRFGENQELVLRTAQEKKRNVIVATDILGSLYDNVIPSRGDLTDLYYLKKMGCKDIVASAGISMREDLFGAFCEFAQGFRLTAKN